MKHSIELTAYLFLSTNGVDINDFLSKLPAGSWEYDSSFNSAWGTLMFTNAGDAVAFKLRFEL